MHRCSSQPRQTSDTSQGLRALTELARTGDLHSADLDPACYLDRTNGQGELFARDWEAQQRALGLPVVRSAGVFVGRADRAGLRQAFGVTLAPGTVRVVSLHGRWLERGCSQEVLRYVRACDDPLAFVLAGQFDPLVHPGAVEGLRTLSETAAVGGRRAELLRTDTTGVGFAALGGTLGAVGLTTTTRHHGLPLGKRAGEEYEQRHCIPYVFTRSLLSWQKGTTLGALTPFGGAGLTSCECRACCDRDLNRFDREWPGMVPADVRADAREHVWVPKTCATCADVLWASVGLGRVSGTWLAGPSVAGRAMIVGLWA
jgi:hypothetical protein